MVRQGRRRFIVLTFSALALLVWCGPVLAQSGTRVPNNNVLTILVRTTITALNHANRTGNYTVFRDLGSAGFQKANTAAKLAVIFSKLRRLDLDLGPIVLFDPKFTQPPAIDKNGMLRLNGFFPTSPQRVNFSLSYQRIAHSWRLFGISVSSTKTPARINTPKPN